MSIASRVLNALGLTAGQSTPPATAERVEPVITSDAPQTPVISFDDLPAASQGFYQDVVDYALFDGDKFPGGFGATKSYLPDYWILRARSKQLFDDNLYLRGLIRRLVTNEINTGLFLESQPDEEVLGLELGSLDRWSERYESLFSLYGKTREIVDFCGEKTLAQIQAHVRQTALIEGDILVVQHIHTPTQLPQIQTIPGGYINSPVNSLRLPSGEEVKHGVHLDANGRHKGYWITDYTGQQRYQPAYAPSGRRVAWLVYGTDRLHDAVRGQPLVSIVLQSLRELDRFRDAVQRKAVVNSLLAMFIKKDKELMGTRPLTGGATRRDKAIVQGPDDGKPRRFDFTQAYPGLVVQELQAGEEPVAFNSTMADLNMGAVEYAILSAVAWANEVPPEILVLAFEKNYSASQAALNEFKIYLNKVRANFGEQFLDRVAQDALIGFTLTNKIQTPGLLEAMRDVRRFDELQAWFNAEWCGQIKPSTDLLKTVRALGEAVDEGFITRARASREFSGTKFSRNALTLVRENQQIADAQATLADLKRRERTAITEDDS